MKKKSSQKKRAATNRVGSNVVVRLRNEIERLQADCAEAYQVVGHMLRLGEKLPRWTDDDVERALDNLWAAASGKKRPHHDLLPWPKRARRAKPNTRAMENEE